MYINMFFLSYFACMHDGYSFVNFNLCVFDILLGKSK